MGCGTSKRKKSDFESFPHLEHAAFELSFRDDLFALELESPLFSSPASKQESVSLVKDRDVPVQLEHFATELLPADVVPPFPFFSGIVPPSNAPVFCEDRSRLFCPPPYHAALSMVSGPRGHDCRGNLISLRSRELAFFCDTVVCILSTLDNQSQRFFFGHSETVTAMAYHPQRHTIASSQAKNGIVLVWDASTFAILCTLHFGHDETVKSMSFSSAGDFLFVLGVGSLCSVKVFEASTGAQVACLSVPSRFASPVFVCGHDTDNSSFVSGGLNHLCYWNISKAELVLQQSFSIPDAKCFVTSCCFLQSFVVFGLSTGYVLVCSQQHPLWTFKCHDAFINHIMSFADSGLLTCASDGKLCLWHFRADESEFSLVHSWTILDDHGTSASLRSVSIFDAPNSDSSNDILELVFKCGGVWTSTNAGEVFSCFPDRPQATVLNKPVRFLTGYGGDLRKTSGPTSRFLAFGSICGTDVLLCGGVGSTVSLLHAKTLCLVASWNCDPCATAGCILEPSGVLLGDKSGSVTLYQFEDRTFDHAELWRSNDAREMINCVAVAVDKSFICVASADQYVYVYDWSSRSLLFRLRGHSSAVKYVDFSQDSHFLRTNSEDSELLFWDLHCGRTVSSLHDVQNVQWAKNSCPFGWDVQGLWDSEPVELSQTPIVRQNPAYPLLAVGRRDGALALYGSPCVGSGFSLQSWKMKTPAMFREYHGHSTAICALSWSSCGSFLYSVSRDSAIFKWTVVGPSPSQHQVCE
eukprot:ANDGO_01412.mRNA.1 77 kDa echinoderm microtubule-associated protein